MADLCVSGFRDWYDAPELTQSEGGCMLSCNMQVLSFTSTGMLVLASVVWLSGGRAKRRLLCQALAVPVLWWGLLPLPLFLSCSMMLTCFKLVRPALSHGNS